MNRYAKPENFGHPIRNPLIREHFVYRTYNHGGELLYVGCTARLDARLAAHRSQANWAGDVARIKVAGPYNYEVARQVEYDAIEGERSLHNYSSERRALAALHNRVVDIYMEALRVHDAPDGEWVGRLHMACRMAEETLPYSNLGPIRFTDLTLPTARRVVADCRTELLGGVA